MNRPLQQVKINKSQARQALLRSGYLLESRIENILSEKGYNVDANAVYTDPLTKKSREIDLYAMGAKRVWKEEHFVFPCFLIECINNPQPITFITKEAQIPFSFHNDLKISGLPVKIIMPDEEESWEMLSDFLHMDEYHHYCKDRIATQFCSFNQKKNSNIWMASHDDFHFDCLKKLCNAVDYFSETHFKGWFFEEGVDEDINLQIYYPLIIVQGDLFDARPSRKSVRLYNKNHIQYRQNAIVDGEEEVYQIDIITESFFPRFIEMVEDEIQKIVRRMQRRKNQILQSIKVITDNAIKAKNEKDVLEAMKF